MRSRSKKQNIDRQRKLRKMARILLDQLSSIQRSCGHPNRAVFSERVLGIYVLRHCKDCGNRWIDINVKEWNKHVKEVSSRTYPKYTRPKPLHGALPEGGTGYISDARQNLGRRMGKLMTPKDREAVRALICQLEEADKETP